MLGALTIGPVTAADRNDTTGFRPRTGFVTVPRGTLTIRVVMTATKYAGAYNDGYLDNVSLMLSSAPPTPVLGKVVNVAPVSGLVLIKPPRGRSLDDAFDPALPVLPALAKGQGFVALTAARQVPNGSQVDARAGTLQVTTATNRRHVTQIATLSGALFSLSQSRARREKGLTVFALLEGDFPGAPAYRSCGAHAAPDGSGPGAGAASVSPTVLQTLHARDRHGRFGTRGRYSSATVRGTVWDTVDRCDGTLTVVKRGTVRVTDFRRKLTITVHAGKRYLSQSTVATASARSEVSMGATAQLLQNNEAYAAGFDHAGMAARPAMKVAIVTCMDARVDPARLLGLEVGDAHVIRNAGGVVTDDAIRSLSISQHHLGTEEIILVHHTDCGMLTFTDEEFAQARELSQGQRPPWQARTFTNLEEDVRDSIRLVLENPFIPRKESVRGFVYEVETGRVRARLPEGAATNRTRSHGRTLNRIVCPNKCRGSRSSPCSSSPIWWATTSSRRNGRR